MALQAKASARPVDPGTLDEDDTALDVAPGGAVDTQLGHRWDNRRRPKRGPHIAKHADQVSRDAAELERCLRDPEWRLFSGCLYRIIAKGESPKNEDGEVIDEGDSFVMPFKPNRAQRRFIMRPWHRNVILKARHHADRHPLAGSRAVQRESGPPGG
ncbi:hypothetical protein [Variovorax sp. UC122_21]|uniref:hypothetical protein n=1 Tax=Variovorax sp. UC122_21 TaxID=3374554 RepID=UPI00375809F7